jgi:hypothetical protein
VSTGSGRSTGVSTGVITGADVSALMLTGEQITAVPTAYPARVPDFAEDTSSELERKAKTLEVVALVETVTYLLLAYFWLVAQSDAGTAIVGFFHGLVWMAFVAMVVFIRANIGWTWGYTVLVVVTGPIGGVLVWWRLMRTPRSVLVPHASPRGGR